MAGVGKLLKQAQKMQRGIAEAQQQLAAERLEVSHGGGAIRVTVDGHGLVHGLSIDPEFLKEEKSVVEQALVLALQEASAKARALHEATMSKATAGFSLPGMWSPVTPSFDKVRQLLKMLPGMGHRSAERLALHLLVERPGKLAPLLESLQAAAAAVRRCGRCGSLAETELCPVCQDVKRDPAAVCVVEQVPDLMAIERSAAYRGTYHVLHGRLSPINGVGPDQLNLATFEQRLKDEPITEVVLALGNDIEGEATCHYVTEAIQAIRPSIKVSRIGFGLPSGSGLTFADPATLRSALEGRRDVAN
jgi:recombination protein RecR